MRKAKSTSKELEEKGKEEKDKEEEKKEEKGKEEHINYVNNNNKYIYLSVLFLLSHNSHVQLVTHT